MPCRGVAITPVLLHPVFSAKLPAPCKSLLAVEERNSPMV
jgi:hypothetical protein